MNNNQEQSSSVALGEKQVDFYQVLGLNEEATYEEIKRQWLKLSLIYHPDKCDGNNEKFRKINQAYKVLSDPNNRKKYNDSLAKTYDQLKEADRDVEYHVNEEFTQTNKEGKKEFNREKFLETFEQTRKMDKDLSQIEVVGENEQHTMASKSIEDLMVDRDRDLETFQNQTHQIVEKCGKGLNNNDYFNAVFQQYKSLTGRGDVEEVQDSGLLDELAGKNVGLVDQHFTPMNTDLLCNLADNIMMQQQANMVDENANANADNDEMSREEQMRIRMEAYQSQSESLFKSPKFKNNLDDSNKLLVDDIDDEEEEEK